MARHPKPLGYHEEYGWGAAVDSMVGGHNVEAVWYDPEREEE